VPRPARYVLPLEIVTAHDPLRQERLEGRENQKPFIKSPSSLLAFSVSVLFLGRENIAANGSGKRAWGYGRQPHLEVLPLPPAKGNALLREPTRVGVACRYRPPTSDVLPGDVASNNLKPEVRV
jgi:hypothetical protein